jgi:hypothetical protein
MPLVVRRRASAVSNHEATSVAFILRDARSALLRMRVWVNRRKNNNGNL